MDTLPETAADLLAAYRARRLSPVEVVQALLRRVEEMQPTLNAFIAVTAEQALAQARRAERRLAQGDESPLLGVPISLKDLFDQRGVATTAGSSLRRETVAAQDAPVVRRLFAAGAISIGKNNLHEVAYGVISNNPHFGAVRNPWDHARTPGGSSGGSGAAVAAGLGPMSMGSDTGGSIRIPAALCGVVGLKPTYGRVPKAGVFPLSVSLDHAGPLARTVADAAATLEVIAGHHAADPTSVRHPVERYTQALDQSPAGLRVGVIEQHMRDLHPEVGAAVEEAAQELARLGVSVRSVRWPELDAIPDVQRPIQFAEASAVHREALAAAPEAYGEDVRLRLREGLSVTAVDYLAARERRPHLIAAANSLFNEVDVLLGPTVPIPAPPIGDPAVLLSDALTAARQELTRLTWPYNTTGLPALSLPCGFTSDGLPIGLQLGARAFAEATLLRLGHAYEQATDWHRRRPDLTRAR